MKLGRIFKSVVFASGFAMANLSIAQKGAANADELLLNPHKIYCRGSDDGERGPNVAGYCNISLQKGAEALFHAVDSKGSSKANKLTAVLESAKAQNKAVAFDPENGTLKISSTPLAEMTDQITDLSGRLAACESQLKLNEKSLNPDQLKAIEKAILNSMSKSDSDSSNKKH